MEVKSSVNSVTASQKDEKQLPIADRLLQYAKNSPQHSIQLFRDQRLTHYICISDNESRISQYHKIKSSYVRLWLVGLMYKKENKAANINAIKQALDVLMAEANEGPVIKLYNRVARAGSNIWIDLCDDSWRAIKINNEGWSIATPPILFRRFKNQKALPDPSRKGSIIPLLKFPKFDNLGDQLLYIVKVVSWAIPDIAHLVSMVYGKQGGGKSTLQKIAKHCIDPSIILAHASIPKDRKELIRILDQNYISIFDNISYMPSWASDVFCSAVTGSGQSYRDLYSDSEEVIYEFKRVLGFNGINIPGSKPDLLDRSGIFYQDIPDEDLLTEKDLSAFIEKNTPIILGGILDILVKAIQLYPEMAKKDDVTLYRLADFTVWGCCITEALGLPYQYFLDAYFANINNQKVDAFFSSPISDCLVLFLKLESQKLDSVNWRGTASMLYTEIKNAAKELNISTSQKAFPKTPRTLSIELNKLIPCFQVIGYVVERDRTGDQRTITFRRVEQTKRYDKPDDWGKGPKLEYYLDPTLETPPASSNLQERMKELLGFLSLVEKALGGEPVDLSYITTEFVKIGWKASEVKQIINLLMRDGTIFCPRPGFYKVTS